MSSIWAEEGLRWDRWRLLSGWRLSLLSATACARYAAFRSEILRRAGGPISISLYCEKSRSRDLLSVPISVVVSQRDALPPHRRASNAGYNFSHRCQVRIEVFVVARRRRRRRAAGGKRQQTAEERHKFTRDAAWRELKGVANQCVRG